MMEQPPQQQEQKRQRRIRYSGSFPKKYEERHKEHNGDDATIARVLLKGGTPAGSHVPIMPMECLMHLGLLPTTQAIQQLMDDSDSAISIDDFDYARDGPLMVVDCTLGYGGHSRLILDALSEWVDDNSNVVTTCTSNHTKSAILASFDRDGIELVKAKTRLKSRWVAQGADVNDRLRLECIWSSFANIRDELSHRSLPRVHALLADLGCSSMQVDDPRRGFTWKAEGPLDMRMDDSAMMTAADLLANSTVPTLTSVLRENSDFDKADARQLAIPRPTTTLDLDVRVRGVTPPLLPETDGGKGIKSRDLQKDKELLNSRVARVMQALRIEVNSEFDQLDKLLKTLPSVLAPGGRAGTFHSGGYMIIFCRRQKYS
jgi:16S rRNA (cytosine1402-N4)-methyltransferase